MKEVQELIAPSYAVDCRANHFTNGIGKKLEIGVPVKYGFTQIFWVLATLLSTAVFAQSWCSSEGSGYSKFLTFALFWAVNDSQFAPVAIADAILILPFEFSNPQNLAPEIISGAMMLLPVLIFGGHCMVPDIISGAELQSTPLPEKESSEKPVEGSSCSGTKSKFWDSKWDSNCY